MTRIAVLVSVGRHPVSGRPRPARLDAVAVDLALRQQAATAFGLHAGPADAAGPVLRGYLGLGLGELIVCDLPHAADPFPALLASLLADPPDLVLAGGVAETGESSGMTPFWLAERLGWPMVANIASLAVADRRATLIQAMPGGRRRRLEAPLPLVASVDRAAGPPRLSAFGPARRGRLIVAPAAAIDPDDRHTWPMRASRARPKRLAAPVGAGADRLGAIMSGVAPGSAENNRQAQRGLAPDAAADRILAFLEREGLWRSAQLRPPPTPPAGDETP